jgi:hypothetical protein
MEYIEGYNKYGYNMDVMRKIKNRYDKEENANLRDIIIYTQGKENIYNIYDNNETKINVNILWSNSKCLITYKKNGDKEKEIYEINEIFKDYNELEEFLK